MRPGWDNMGKRGLRQTRTCVATPVYRAVCASSRSGGRNRLRFPHGLAIERKAHDEPGVGVAGARGARAKDQKAQPNAHSPSPEILRKLISHGATWAQQTQPGYAQSKQNQSAWFGRIGNTETYVIQADVIAQLVEANGIELDFRRGPCRGEQVFLPHPIIPKPVTRRGKYRTSLAVHGNAERIRIIAFRRHDEINGIRHTRSQAGSQCK